MLMYVSAIIILLVSSGTLYIVSTEFFEQNVKVAHGEGGQHPYNTPMSFISSDDIYPAFPNFLLPFQFDLAAEREDNIGSSKISLTTNDVANITGAVQATNNTAAPVAWKIIAGKWMSVADGVRAGDDLDRLHRILVRPELTNSTDLEINTSFTIGSRDANRTSYVSIVYSWKDPQNFRYAGLTLLKNQTFMDFGTVNNGTVSWDPPWPGSRADLELSPGEPVNMTLSLQDNSQDLSVNGIEISSETNTDLNENGYVGLSYGRIYDIMFHRLNVQEM